MRDLEGKVVTITGAGGGMGRELAVLLRRDYHCHLALCDLDEERLKETLACVSFVTKHDVDKLGAMGGEALHPHLRTTIHVVDVSKRDLVLKFAEDVRATHGRCELVFNNAGVAQSFAFDQVEFSQLDRVMDINLGGVINVAKAFLPLLKQAKQACLVNTSSMEGFMPFPGNSAYVMSKFAVRGLSEALQLESLELYPHVGICCVYPGFIRTNIILNSRDFMMDPGVGGQYRITDFKQIDRGLKSFGSTSALGAAKQIIEGVRAGQSRILVGSDAKVFDLVMRLMPSFWLQGVWRWRALVGTTVFLTRFVGRKVIWTAVVALVLLRAKQLEAAMYQVVVLLTKAYEQLGL